MSDLAVGCRVKVVFVDGNLREGRVVTKYGVFDKEDDHYIYITPDGDRSTRIGHGFVIKATRLEEEI